MTAVARILPAAAIIALLGLFLFGVNRLVGKQHARIKADLDQFDYVVIEAHPDQLLTLKDEFHREGWKLAESKPYNSVGMLYRFEASEGTHSPLSEVLGFGNERIGRRAATGVSYQMKIKAHGKKSELNA